MHKTETSGRSRPPAAIRRASLCLATVLMSAIFGALLVMLASVVTIVISSIGFLPSILIAGIILTAIGSLTLWKVLGELRSGTSIKELQSRLARRETSIKSLQTSQTALSKQLEAYESELSRSYAYFRQLMKTFGMATFHCDLEDRFEWAHNFSGDRSNVVGRTVDDVLPKDAAFLLSLLMENARADEQIHSGQLEIEVDGEMRHYGVQVAPRYDRAGNLTGTICVSNDVTEKARWNDHLAKMTLEVNHRARNLLAIIVSMLGQTAKNATSIDAFKNKITDRVSSLAKSIDLVSKDSWTATSLTRLIQIQLRHVMPNFEDQVELSGAEIYFAPKAIQNIGLAIHELSTNARNFGALSSPSGRVAIAWEVVETTDQQSEMRLIWTEKSDVPAPKTVDKKLGLKILEDIVAQELGGQSRLTWTDDGLVYEMTIPDKWFESTPLLNACEKLGHPVPAAA